MLCLKLLVEPLVYSLMAVVVLATAREGCVSVEDCLGLDRSHNQSAVLEASSPPPSPGLPAWHSDYSRTQSDALESPSPPTCPGLSASHTCPGGGQTPVRCG